MKKNAMRKNLYQSILKSFGRYLAIVMIIALGASMFVGLLMTKSDMVATGQKYMDEQNMFDLRLISPYGWDPEHVDRVAQMDGVADAEGVIYLDAVAGLNDAQASSVYRFYAVPERMNKIVLRGGRLPQSPDECLADGFMATEEFLGTKVRISEDNEETTLDAFRYKTFTVVGYVSSPLYMDMNRGNTSIGSGSLASFFYVPRDGFDVDYYTEINVTIPGDYAIYSDAYNDAVEEMADFLEPMAEPLVEKRFRKIYNEAMAEYKDGLHEYEDGLKTYLEEKEKALQELEDAYQKLLDGEQQIKDNEQLLIDGRAQLADARVQLESARAELDAGWQEYEESKSTIDAIVSFATGDLLEQQARLTQEISQIDAELAQVDEKLDTGAIVDAGKIALLNAQIMEMEGRIGATELAIQASERTLESLKQSPLTPQEFLDNAQRALDALIAQKSEYETQQQTLIQQRDELQNAAGDLNMDPEQIELLARRNELLAKRAQNAALLEAVQLALDGADQTLSGVYEQLTSAEAQLQDGERQYNEGMNQVNQGQWALELGKVQLEEAKIEIADGWVAYEEGKAEAEEEFAKAEEELAEAKLKLDDALDTINSMSEADVFVLDRSSNIGYGSLDSSSDIVAGVSRVFPAFFLLVAAMVCITTMTRMIDEERTQIGTLKALGYSSGEIISKYLIYAGSGAVVGCGLGVLVGSIAFPTILWEAYKIMLYITPGIVLQFNWWLCLAVVAAYTAVMLFVTWYCCRRTLKEEPAELIRPKAPEAGKKIFMEYLPFWHRISFLNKVTIRNIFRYRQRLAMMMLGIGGCTALLLTGFGLRDSIVNVVDYQFEHVTIYDLTVYFSKGQTQEQQERFIKLTDECTENVLFYNQISVEVEHDEQVKEIYLMTADSKMQEFIDFRTDGEALPMPRSGEVLLSVGVAENMGIREGDTISMRNADMEKLELTVSGIYENYVYNYAIVIPETIEDQWNRTPEQQMALVQVQEGQDVYKTSTVITDLSDVQNVAVSQDLADMVGSMMDALDLVVWVIVVCAGLLATIVLYNLTNININERIREIATIKVLGFNASETAAYVFKENLSLTVIGAGLGLGLGYLLLVFVMMQIKIDMVWFKAMIMNPSYIWSVVLTILAACVVNFVFYFKLDKINMAEALKSVE